MKGRDDHLTPGGLWHYNGGQLSLKVDHVFYVDEAGWLSGVRRRVSPNRDERPAGSKPELLVIHCISLPEGQYGGADVERLFMNELEDQNAPGYESLKGLHVSAHLFIRRDGAIIQFVPFGERAWHAGVSQWEGRSHVNDFSIGIEMEGTDRTVFEDCQYESLIAASRALMRRYPDLNSGRFCGHSDVAPGRKTDPGLGFDWRRLREGVDTPCAIGIQGEKRA